MRPLRVLANGTFCHVNTSVSMRAVQYYLDGVTIETPLPVPSDILSSRMIPGNLVYNGVLPDDVPGDSLITYWAASPPDRRQSYFGSAMPFPSAEVAYSGSPNTGTVKANHGKYTVQLHFPNSFYSEMGTKLMPPHLLISAAGKTQAILLSR